MGRRSSSTIIEPESTPMVPATTVEARESQLISLAVDLAEKQLREGTASPSVIAHYLKLGSTKDRVEKEILELRKDLIVAQTETLRAAKRMEELYTEAMDAMRSYNGEE